jgi:hypothetical protein
MIYIISRHQHNNWDLPFYFYAKIIHNYILNNNLKCDIINEVKSIFKENDIFIIFTPYFKYLNFESIKKNRIILINSEPIKVEKNRKLVVNIINNYRIIFLIDYSKHNIKYLKRKNIETYYSKFIYSKLIENYFDKYEKKKIKDIDFLILGSINERRLLITDKLKYNYKVEYLNTNNYKKIYDYLMRTKIVLIILSNENNNNIDIYRLMILVTLKVFFIHEYVYNKYDLVDKIIFSKYNFFFKKSIKYINISQDDINKITNKLYNFCKLKYNFDTDFKNSNILEYLRI